MADLLVDSDVFIDHLRGARKFRPRRDRISYSVVTRCELFSGRGGEEEGIRLLLAPFRELGIDRGVAELAGRLRREHRVRTADALIGATALAYRLTLLTRNTRDFNGIPRLRVRSPV